jgi:proteasome lid subunit RPN8/RPN11
VLTELRRRGGGRRESGAFLLGTIRGERREIERVVYYDDLDSHALDTGAVVIQGTAYGNLWEICRRTGLAVVADVHTHPGLARQSSIDRANPMIASSGHVAIIVPDFAERTVGEDELGIYRYEGDHEWVDVSGPLARQFFYIGMFG